MPICIECCYPVSQLYHVLHSRNNKATALKSDSNHTKSKKSASHHSSPQKPIPNTPETLKTKPKNTNTGGGGDVRLTQCPRCKRFADKYVEHDFVVLFIDLVLVKPQVSQCDSRGSRYRRNNYPIDVYFGIAYSSKYPKCSRLMV